MYFYTYFRKDPSNLATAGKRSACSMEALLEEVWRLRNAACKSQDEEEDEGLLINLPGCLLRSEIAQRAAILCDDC